MRECESAREGRSARERKTESARNSEKERQRPLRTSRNCVHWLGPRDAWLGSYLNAPHRSHIERICGKACRLHLGREQGGWLQEGLVRQFEGAPVHTNRLLATCSKRPQVVVRRTLDHRISLLSVPDWSYWQIDQDETSLAVQVPTCLFQCGCALRPSG